MLQRFQDLESFTAADGEAAIARNDPEELSLASITAALLAVSADQAEDLCCRLAIHERAVVRGNALISLGHLARRFRSLNEQRVRPLLEAGLRDPDETVRTLAKSASDEISQFLHWTIAGHIYG